MRAILRQPNQKYLGFLSSTLTRDAFIDIKLEETTGLSGFHIVTSGLGLANGVSLTRPIL